MERSATKVIREDEEEDSERGSYIPIQVRPQPTRKLPRRGLFKQESFISGSRIRTLN